MKKIIIFFALLSGLVLLSSCSLVGKSSSKTKKGSGNIQDSGCCCFQSRLDLEQNKN